MAPNSGNGRARRSYRGSGRGGRIFKGRRQPRRKDQLQLDYEMDLLNAERDGRDVEEIKASYRAMRAEKRKEKLDRDMDNYFADQNESATVATNSVADSGDVPHVADVSAAVVPASGS